MNPTCSLCGKPCDFAFEKRSYKLYRCTACTHLFVYPTPSPEAISAVYQESYFHKSEGQSGLGYADYDTDKSFLAPTLDRYIAELSHSTSGRRILDVGCATGFFLDRAKAAGWDTSGVEISEFGAKEAARRGHESVCGTIEDVAGESRFDAITLWDVIEHMTDPMRAVARARKLLVPGGLIAINTVDSASVPARMMGKYWHLVVPPEHLQYFSRKSLISSLEANGFDILAAHRITKRFSIAYVFMTLYRWQRLAIWLKISNMFSRGVFKRASLPLQTFDNFYVLARKRA